MDIALPIQSVLALNKGKYLRQTVSLAEGRCRVYSTKNMDASTTLLHYHEETHLSFILNGGIIDKRKRSEAERFSGDLMFFHAGEPHQSIYKIFPSLNINLELAPSYLTENNFSESLLCSNVSENSNAKFILLKIYKEILWNDDLSASSIETLLLNLMTSEISKKHGRPKWIDRVVELLRDNWSEPLSLKELAKTTDVHPVTISKHFPIYFSCTLGEYRRRLKIEKALRFIKTSTLSLTEIAHRCGFADQSHFTRTFKQVTGFLPRQYHRL